jgi:uncharacterized repeat protein (TIGR03847 family)
VSASFQLDGPDHFTAGAVGPPGQRVFYLQGREADTMVTLKCEKEQVAALAEYLGGLLARLPTATATPDDKRELLQPFEAAWPVGSLGVGYDGERDRIVVVANERVEQDGEEEQGEGEPDTPGAVEPASARFAITRVQAAAFVERARLLQRAGRPTCPMCGEPKDPAGHVCPRSNGHIVPKV